MVHAFKTVLTERGVVGQHKHLKFTVGEEGVPFLHVKLDIYWHRGIRVTFLGNKRQQQEWNFPNSPATANGREINNPPKGDYEVVVYEDGPISNHLFLLEVKYPSIQVLIQPLTLRNVKMRDLFHLEIQASMDPTPSSIVYEYRRVSSSTTTRNEGFSEFTTDLFIDPFETYEFRYYLLNASKTHRSVLSNTLTCKVSNDILKFSYLKSNSSNSSSYRQGKMEFGPLPITENTKYSLLKREAQCDEWQLEPFDFIPPQDHKHLYSTIETIRRQEIDATYSVRFVVYHNGTDYVLMDTQCEVLKSSECYLGIPAHIPTLNNGILQFKEITNEERQEQLTLYLDGTYEYWRKEMEQFCEDADILQEVLTRYTGNYTLKHSDDVPDQLLLQFSTDPSVTGVITKGHTSKVYEFRHRDNNASTLIYQGNGPLITRFTTVFHSVTMSLTVYSDVEILSSSD